MKLVTSEKDWPPVSTTALCGCAAIQMYCVIFKEIKIPVSRPQVFSITNLREFVRTSYVDTKSFDIIRS